MRLPNGFGSCYKLSGNRRKPWIARVTTGWSDEGKQEYYTIGYFETRALAMSALAEYNKNPIGATSDITLSQIFEKWSSTRFKKISKDTIDTYNAAYKHLAPLHDAKIKDIRKSHLQDIIDSMTLSKSSMQKVKILAANLFDYALGDNIVNQNYGKLIELPTEDKKEKEIFTDFEIKTITEQANFTEWIDTVLILIYTGMRISELLVLTKFDIDIEHMIITGGIKTPAGKNRMIPLHPKIQQYVRNWYNKEGSHLITRNGKKISTKYFRENLYRPALEKIGVRPLNPHSCRHTFASLINRSADNKVAIQRIIGHSDFSTTANIYTHPDMQELRKAIESM